MSILKRSMKRSLGDRAFDVANAVFISFFTFLCLFPFLHMMARSLSSDSAIAQGLVSVWPVEFQTKSLLSVVNNKGVLSSMFLTIFVAAVGTTISMTVTVMFAYPLSRRNLVGRSFFTRFIVVTMLFSGGMIPSFLVVKSLGLLNSIWAIILPSAINTFNLIVMRTFFMGMPVELEEAARIDGYNNVQILVRIVLPLSLASIATLTLFYAVSYWNSYFNALIYIDDPALYTLQVKLRLLLLAGDSSDLLEGGNLPAAAALAKEALKASTVVFATVPILALYPWLQKYFVKGVTIGALKG